MTLVSGNNKKGWLQLKQCDCDCASKNEGPL